MLIVRQAHHLFGPTRRNPLFQTGVDGGLQRIFWEHRHFGGQRSRKVTRIVGEQNNMGVGNIPIVVGYVMDFYCNMTTSNHKGCVDNICGTLLHSHF